MSDLKSKAQELLALADVKINGSRSWDIQVHNEDFYSKVFSQGSIGAGEAYMDGWWDVKSLDEFFTKIFKVQLHHKIQTFNFVWNYIKASTLNLQTKSGSKKVAEEHYDLGNDFYKGMLDKHMQYTCGYWKNAENLDKAQINKLDLVCKKLKLKKGETVLELGCGWGGFAHYASKNYGVKVTAYNISKEQVKYAQEWNKYLPNKIILTDYREATGKYDKVVSVGLCEHIGYKNYKTFMEVAHRCLKDNGLFLMHTIGANVSVKMTDPWIQKYIFPNSMLPSISQISKAAEGLFVVEDLHNFGPDYYKTLMAWDANFRKNWNKFESQHGKRFYRMWRFYLMSSAGQFKARKIQLWQFVLSKGDIPSYEPVR